MPRLEPVFEEVDGRMIFNGQYVARDEQGIAVVTGHLEVDVIGGTGGLTRTDVKFVSNGKLD